MKITIEFSEEEKALIKQGATLRVNMNNGFYEYLLVKNTAVVGETTKRCYLTDNYFFERDMKDEILKVKNEVKNE